MKIWTLDELTEIYHSPLMSLVAKANQIHCQFHNTQEIQVNKLISIKTGGCIEDCRYCAQSSYYQTPVKAQKMMPLNEVIRLAEDAKKWGVTRVCLGAAWREVKDGKAFDDVLEMVKTVNSMGLEVCCTLGFLNNQQAQKLKEAGLYAYNHNLDTSEKFYPSIITTRCYEDRLKTLKIASESGLSVCCGGIIGMGETVKDRLELLLQLTQLECQPDSVPINRLEPIPGTPFEHQEKVKIWDMIRMIATTRIALPKAMIRFSSGRLGLTYEQQALCFFAGVNSIFVSDKLLTVENPSLDQDEEMFEILGLTKRISHKQSRGVMC